MQELEWIRAAAAGDQHAFAHLVAKYQTPVYNLVLRTVQHAHDAMDLTQETFVRAWRGLPQFRAQAQFSTWLYRLASNVCIDFLRAQQHRSVVCLSEMGEEGQTWEMPDPAPGPESSLLRQEHAQQLRRALAQLRPEQRQILTLRAMQGLSYQQIAQVLGLREGTVKSRLARAREQLRVKMQAEGNEIDFAASKEAEGGGTDAL